MFVAIPTTSGTGSEVSPFAVITDPRNGRKYPLADYVMTPDLTAIDPTLVRNMPRALVAAPGLDAITHAVEAHASVLSSTFTRPWSVSATRELFAHLRDSQRGDYSARAACHNAATLAGMALSNAFVGVAHSVAHQLGSRFHLPHGVCCTIALPSVIRFNATPGPARQTAFPQFTSPTITVARYAELADAIGVGAQASTEQAKVEAFIAAFVALARDVGVPTTVREAIPALERNEYMDACDGMALDAFDDQCTVSNPRFPLISELSALLREMWDGKTE